MFVSKSISVPLERIEKILSRSELEHVVVLDADDFTDKVTQIIALCNPASWLTLFKRMSTSLLTPAVCSLEKKTSALFLANLKVKSCMGCLKLL